MDAGVAREAQIFVACLPFSGLIYAEATWTQRVEDWLSSHVRAVTFIGGVAAALVPDNLKSGVTRANFFDPVLNASYYELARHYGTAVLPARVGKPRDKPAVESAVLQVERWILAPLRHRTFFGLDELNAAIAPLREALNNRPLSPPREGTRRSVFEAEERALLRPLPDWAEVDRDMRRHRHLTVKLVWGEYIQAHPDGYGFTQFCEYFRRWRREQGRTVTLRQEHCPGAAL